MRLRYVYPALLVVGLCSLRPAHAQTSFDLNIGFGSAWDGSNGQGIEGANSAYAFESCAPGAPIDTYCQSTPSLSGFFLGLGGDLMLTKRYGVGAEVSFEPGRQNYGPLQYRQTFYDFNGIYAPINQKRVILEIQGGIGGSRTSFAINESSCVGIVACSSETVPFANSNHFQVHVGVGLQLFVSGHFFVRPQFDYHYVPNYGQVFNSNSVPAAMVWVGYSFGDR